MDLAPLTRPLDEARLMLARDGSVSIRSLRRMLRKHGLPVIRIGQRHAVTDDTMKELIERCHVHETPPASGSGAAAVARLCGSSATVTSRSQRDALKLTAQGLKRRSRST